MCYHTLAWDRECNPNLNPKSKHNANVKLAVERKPNNFYYKSEKIIFI